MMGDNTVFTTPGGAPTSAMALELLSFPSRDELERRLDEVGLSLPAELVQTITERFTTQSYDGTAFTLVLIGLFLQYEAASGSDVAHLLPRLILALTSDGSLAETASKVLTELREQTASQ